MSRLWVWLYRFRDTDPVALVRLMVRVGVPGVVVLNGPTRPRSRRGCMGCVAVLGLVVLGSRHGSGGVGGCVGCVAVLGLVVVGSRHGSGGGGGCVGCVAVLGLVVLGSRQGSWFHVRDTPRAVALRPADRSRESVGRAHSAGPAQPDSVSRIRRATRRTGPGWRRRAGRSGTTRGCDRAASVGTSHRAGTDPTRAGRT